MEAAALAKIIPAIAKPVAKEIFKQAKSYLNPTEFEQAFRAGIIDAHEEEEKLALQQQLFYRANPDGKNGVSQFLSHFFTQEGVQKELLKPINNQSKPDVDFLVSAFKETANNFQIELQLERIEPWLRQFVETYFAKTSTYLKYQVAKEKYFQQLLTRYDQIQFAGIPVAGQEEEKVNQLAEIFVMPDVEEKASRSFDFIQEENQLGKQIKFTPLDSSGRKFLAQELLQRNQAKKFVLLGAPGSGKTTLMSYFAVILACKESAKLGLDNKVDWLPIILRIRDLSRQPEKISILDYAKLYAEKNLAVEDLPVGFFEHWLENGRAIILLDGLDEIPEEAKRYQIVGRIESFLSRFGENRAIITSRPAGYKQDFFRTGEFPHFQLQSFDDEKIEEFINRWYDSRFADKGERERRKESLRKALNDNERIKLLGRNPLLLTIIALIHRYQAQLPKERHKLYDKAVETLLTSWDKNKDLSNHEQLKYLELYDLRRLMAIIAFWIHTQDTAGDGEGGTLIDRDELLEKLSREIKNLKQVELYQARLEAKRFIELIQERTGLLNEQGQDCYAFVHKTFQEYLCAEEIDYQGKNDDFNLVLQQISDRLHDPHWREVLLLLIAQQMPNKAARAIRAVLNNGSEYEQWLHRDLLFAGDCLAENPKYLQAADRDLPQEIIRRLVELEVKGKNLVGKKISDEVFRILCSFAETEFESQALGMLKDKEKSIGRWRLYEYGAYFLEKEQVIEELLNLLTSEDEYECRIAAFALGKLGVVNKKILEALLDLLSEKDWNIYTSTVGTLRQLGAKSEQDIDNDLIEALLDFISDKNSKVRFNAINTLSNLDVDNEKVIQTLLNVLLDKNDDVDVRYMTARALGKLGANNEKVIKVLLELLSDSGESLRESAAFALGFLGVRSDKVINLLFDVFINDDVSSVRCETAGALVRLGIVNNNQITCALLDLTSNNNAGIRGNAAYSLGYLEVANQRVINSLFNLLMDKDSFVRGNAAYALGKLGVDNERFAKALLNSLEDEELYVRSSVIHVLGKLGKNNKKITTVVIQWLQQHQNSEYIGAGIDALWDLTSTNK